MSGIVQLPNNDLTKLNIQFLMVAQKQLRVDSVTAKHQFGMDDTTAEFLVSMSADEIMKLAESGISTMQFSFPKESLPHLSNYIQGDNLAITQAVLGQGSRI